MTETILKLKKPVEVHGTEIKELKLREMTTEDIAECGYPISFITRGEEQEAKVNMQVAMKYIGKMADVPPSTVKKLCPQDFLAAVNMVTIFFGSLTVEDVKI